MEKKAYLFWYKQECDSITEYVYVIATSLRQAKFFWHNYLKYVIGYCEDYDIRPVNMICENQFVKQHQVGDILGENAII